MTVSLSPCGFAEFVLWILFLLTVEIDLFYELYMISDIKHVRFLAC
jgi:hypothetical protein